MGGFAPLLTTGLQLGAQLASQRQAADMLRQQAEATEAASQVQAQRLREQYAGRSKDMARQQRAAASLARVQAAKNGAAGASQDAVAAARAAQARAARNGLFMQAAADTGDAALAAGLRGAQLRGQAAQQDLAYDRSLWAGLGQMAQLGLPTLNGSGGAR